MRQYFLEPKRMRWLSIFVFATYLLAGCAVEQQPGADNASTAVRWITFDELKQSLEGHPATVVGFDIDDTLLFSSPGFHYGRQKYSPGSNSFTRLDEFWLEMNNGLDAFSLPKTIARKLIQFHRERGDVLYFITGRPPTETETLTDLIGRTFGIDNPNPVIFTGNIRAENPKVGSLKTHGVMIFYGDSNGDIEAAQIVGARAVRILRAGNSTSGIIPNPGFMGEEVLADSEY